MSSKSRAEQLAEVAEHVESHDMADVMDTAVWETGMVAEPMVVTSVRLPRPLMQRVRAQADAAGVPATALIRSWVEDRLAAQETGDIGRDQLVAMLRSVLADLDPLRAYLAGENVPLQRRVPPSPD
ncbi:MAG: CopG family antitoxin [Pseudonocardiaceae bacterium]